MAASLPLAVVLFLLLAASAVPATKHSGGARMVIILHGDGGGAAGGARASNGWRHGRLLEDEVAPELMELGGMLGAGGGIDYSTLHPDGQVCLSGSQCAARGRGSSTRGCTYKEHCPH
ncbi:unnamed protein product [Urochloa decumbens]|uniref:Uncharacterized protein n=1 Tax=Urochloa decumbens TaxID=240449 RepID=A0ABC9GF16_9POAL